MEETLRDQLLALPADDRHSPAERMRAAVVTGRDASSTCDAEEAELERRVAAYRRDPSATISWDELERRLLDRESRA